MHILDDARGKASLHLTVQASPWTPAPRPGDSEYHRRAMTPNVKSPAQRRTEWQQRTKPSPASGSTPSSGTRAGTFRSEERRVGKSVDLGGRRIIKKKK